MRIIFTSDIHRKKEIVNQIMINHYADEFYDCGDSELSDYDLKNFYTVKGNCDFRFFPNYRIVKVDDFLKIFITHGHLYKENKMVEIAKENDCNLIVHGHTHIKRLDKIGDIYIANPGSIARPRDKESNTFLILDYNENNKELVFEFVKLSL